MRTGIIAKIIDSFDRVINPATEETLAEIKEGSKYHTNEILEDGSDTYFFKESKDGEWLFMKIDANSVFTYASQNNNSAMDYDTARSNYSTLTYGKYSEAL